MNQESYLITMKPKNEQLKKLIAYYYFHVCKNEKHSESFYFYPNYLHALTIYIGNDVKFDSNTMSSNISKSDNDKKVTCLFTVNSNENILVNINSGFHKIGVVFYPLGFNHFIDEPLNSFINKDIMQVNLGDKFSSKFSEITKDTSIEKQFDILEKQLLSIYKTFSEEKLQEIIKEIILTNGTIKVNELEDKFELNRKSILRLFKKHTLTTIEDYKKMVMFRNSLNYALQNKEFINLTDVALYSMYYDQSHFIKHFKSITQETPKTLLPKINKIGDEDLYWHFLKK